MSARVLAIVALIALSACNVENEGDAPPLGAIYFPNAMALSAADAATPAQFLFLASSNFDLRWNAGAVHAFSLDAIDARIAACTELGADECTIDTDEVLADEVVVPSFSTAMTLAPDGRRLFVTTRAGDALTVIDVDPEADDAAMRRGDPVTSSLLGCGGRSDARACDSSTAAGINPRTGEALDWPADPAQLVSGPLSDFTGEAADDARHYVAVAHQAGQVSLYVDPPAGADDERLTLSSVVSGIPGFLADLARDPATGLLHVVKAGSRSIDRVGVSTVGQGTTLFLAAPLLVEGASVGDFSALAFLPPQPGQGVALSEDRAILLSRTPSALVLADVSPERNEPERARVQRVTEVGGGPSRLAQGVLGGRAFAFVSCYNQREVHVVELASAQTRAVVPNLSGPHSLALDVARQRLYVTDFRSSVVRIVDLSPLVDASADATSTTVRTIATLGRPRVIQELR